MGFIMESKEYTFWYIFSSRTIIMRKRTEEIFVKVLRNGFIPQLGMCGPIPNPIKITRGTAHSMIVAGIKVFEFNPVTKETIELTVDNVFADEDATKKEESNNQQTSPAPSKVSEPIKPVTLNGVKNSDKPADEDKKTDEKPENTSDTKKDQNSKPNNSSKGKDEKKNK